MPTDLRVSNFYFSIKEIGRIWRHLECCQGSLGATSFRGSNPPTWERKRDTCCCAPVSAFELKITWEGCLENMDRWGLYEEYLSYTSSSLVSIPVEKRHAGRIERSGFDSWLGTLCCVLGQDTLPSRSASLHRGGYRQLGVTLRWTNIPSKGE